MLGTNVGGYLTTKFALDRTTFGAGVGNPGALDGEAINRTAVRPLHISGKLQIGYDLTMPSGTSCAFGLKIRHSDDDITYEDLDGASGDETVNALDSGAAQKGVVELDVNLIGAKQYIKARVTPVLTASGSSTAEIFGLLTVGGGETIPPTESAN